MTTSETTHAVKPYDTVIIIDSNFDIKELRETLKAQDVYDDEKGKVYNRTTMYNACMYLQLRISLHQP